jgi:alpha,alpha-trehalose phosphorylase
MKSSWLLEEHELKKENLLRNETLFHIANGYVGTRGNFEEGYDHGVKTIRGTYINGFYDLGHFKYAEKFIGFPEDYQKMVNVVDIQGIELWIDGDKFNLFQGKILHYYRALDMEKGYVVRNIIWCSPKGHELEIIIKRMASFTVKELLAFEYSVKSMNYNGMIQIHSIQNGRVKNFSDAKDPRLPHESEQNLIIDQIEVDDEQSIMNLHTKYSKLQLVSGVSHKINKTDFSFAYKVDSDQSIAIFKGNIKQGDLITLEKYGVYVDSRRYENCILKARELLKQITDKSIQYWYKKQEEYLKNFWDQVSIEIIGNDKLTKGIHYNLFGLLQSVGKDRYSNVSAKGLSGEGYEGHYFWDTEIYIFPFFLLNQEKLAKNLLTYRYNILEEARKHARLLGHKQGALYPWRTITGSECSSYFLSGSAQYHINGDIAFTIIQYYLTTLDLDFMEKMGGEMLFEIARLWMDTGHFDKESFKINEVTGPDEYTCLVDNNYFTNSMAKFSLYWAVKVYDLLKIAGKINIICEKMQITEEELRLWKKASDNMYLPVVKVQALNGSGKEVYINPQDDSFLHKKPWDFERTSKDQYPLLLHFHPLYIYRHQVLKQADTVLAHFLTEDYQSTDVMKDSYEYYEKITTHDSSLSTCIYSIVASRLGLTKKAYNYFIQSALFDLEDHCGNTKHGIHTANMGGSYMALVYGFCGLRIKEDGLHFRPRLPKEFDGFCFKMNYRSRRLSIRMNKCQVELQLLNGDPLEVYVYDTNYYLKDTITIDLNNG